MINLKNIFNLNAAAASIFSRLFSTKKDFTFGIGESEIGESSIHIRHYPFEPASVYPQKEIPAAEIDEVHLDNYPPTIKIGDELIFISRESLTQLADFAERHRIKVSKRASNWDWITELFLDTEFDEEQKERTMSLLITNGFTRSEIAALRQEIGAQVHKYNFNTMLWEWVNLGLNDVLSAMRPKLRKEDFRAFYWRAMEIEQRHIKINA